MDEERVRQIIRQELEIFIKAHGWPDEQLQQALLEVAKDHLWRQGLMVKLRYWTNIIGFFGIIGAAGVFILSVLGYEVIGRP